MIAEAGTSAVFALAAKVSPSINTEERMNFFILKKFLKFSLLGHYRRSRFGCFVRRRIYRPSWCGAGLSCARCVVQSHIYAARAGLVCSCMIQHSRRFIPIPDFSKTQPPQHPALCTAGVQLKSNSTRFWLRCIPDTGLCGMAKQSPLRQNQYGNGAKRQKKFRTAQAAAVLFR